MTQAFYPGQGAADYLDKLNVLSAIAVSLTGPQGEVGPALRILGTVANQASLPAGVAGDAYMIGDDLWTYGTEWTNVGVVRGPQGIQGIQGIQGETGPQGIQGETGPQGIQGIQGIQGATGDTGPQGIQGIQGVIGNTGVRGSNISAGSGLPSVSGALSGDLYVNTNNGDVYQFTSSWGVVGNIRGPQGVQGDTGNTGPTGRSVTGISRTGGTGLAGSTDTYTITYSDSTSSTFNVVNGTNGAGAGDMLKSVYDTNNSGVVDSAESVAWAGVTGKPSTFTPAAHGHAIADVTGLQTALDGKQAAGSYAAETHGHAIANVTGLQTALDGKQDNLVSGTHIKTINGVSVVGSGDVVIASGGGFEQSFLLMGA